MRRLTKRQRIAATVLCVLALSFLVLDLAGTGLRSAHGGVRGTLGALYRGTDAAVGPVREFFAVTLPGLRGQLAIGLALTITGALRAFDLVWITTQGGPGTSTTTRSRPSTGPAGDPSYNPLTSNMHIPWS